MRVCRTARRGIFRFKFALLRCEILRNRLLKALASQGFAKRALRAKSLQTKLRRGKFALRCRFNTVVRRLLLCSTEFAPLRNDKIYGAIWRCGGVCSAAHLFCGPGFAAVDKI